MVSLNTCLLAFFYVLAPISQGALARIAPVVKRQQCASTLAIAEGLAQSLQDHWWTGSIYNNGETWTDANAYEDLNNLMLAAGLTTWGNVNSDSKLAKLGLANAGNWDAFFQGSFDDSQWVILSYYKMADYLSRQGKDISNLMGSAAAIYDYVSAQWDTTTCGGGGAYDVTIPTQ